MFTGLVQTTGTLQGRAAREPGVSLQVAAGLGPLEMGESIAVNGACLTVSGLLAGGFEADLSAETARETTLGHSPRGARVNRPRSLALGERLGGHSLPGAAGSELNVEVDLLARYVVDWLSQRGQSDVAPGLDRRSSAPDSRK